MGLIGLKLEEMHSSGKEITAANLSLDEVLKKIVLTSTDGGEGVHQRTRRR